MNAFYVEKWLTFTLIDSRWDIQLGKTHHRQGLAHGDERDEVDEAGNETGNQSGDERFSTTTPDDEIGFFGAIQWW